MRDSGGGWDAAGRGRAEDKARARTGRPLTGPRVAPRPERAPQRRSGRLVWSGPPLPTPDPTPRRPTLRHPATAACLWAAGIALLTPAATAQCQTQKLTGTGAGALDGFGWSLSRSGSTLFVGAIGDDTVLPGAGAVYVFEQTAGVWNQVQKLTNAASNMNSELGNSMSVVGDRALVGTHKHVGGKVLHYQRVAGVWNEVETLEGSNTAQGFHFGHHVILDANGSTAIIGQMRDDYNGFETGSAYVYELSGGSFVEVENLRGSDSALGDRFGRVVAIDGDRILVAGHKHAAEAGKVYVFERDDNGTPLDALDDSWPEVGTLTAADAAPGDHFGLGLSLDGERAAVGAPEDVHGALQTGSVYLWERLGGTWTQVQKITPPDGAAGDGFGTSVVLEGDTLLVGARARDEGAADTGAVYVFKRLAGFYLFTVKLVADDAAAAWNQGDEISLSLLGNEVLSSAWGADGNQGAAYAYRLPEVYCTGKLNTAGCVPQISFTGSHASTTSPDPFKVTAVLIVNKKNGIFFYGTSGKASIPFQGGLLCAGGSIKRTALQNSGGTVGGADCTGKYQYDMNALIQAGTDANLVIGATVNGQYWYRDPLHPIAGSGLSDAIEFTICD